MSQVDDRHLKLSISQIPCRYFLEFLFISASILPSEHTTLPSHRPFISPTLPFRPPAPTLEPFLAETHPLLSHTICIYDEFDHPRLYAPNVASSTLLPNDRRKHNLQPFIPTISGFNDRIRKSIGNTLDCTPAAATLIEGCPRNEPDVL